MFNRRQFIPLFVSVAFGSSSSHVRVKDISALEVQKKEVSAELEKLHSTLSAEISELQSDISEFEDDLRKRNEFFRLKDALERDEFGTRLELRALRQKQDEVEEKITELRSNLSSSEKEVAIEELIENERKPLSGRISYLEQVVIPSNYDSQSFLLNDKDKMHRFTTQSNAPPVWVIQDERDIIKTESDIRKLEFTLTSLNRMHAIKTEALNTLVQKAPLKALEAKLKAEEDSLKKRLISDAQGRLVPMYEKEIMALEYVTKSTKEQMRANREEYFNIQRELGKHTGALSNDELRDRFTRYTKTESKLRSTLQLDTARMIDLQKQKFINDRQRQDNKSMSQDLLKELKELQNEIQLIRADIRELEFTEQFGSDSLELDSKY